VLAASWANTRLAHPEAAVDKEQGRLHSLEGAGDLAGSLPGSVGQVDEYRRSACSSAAFAPTKTYLQDTVSPAPSQPLKLKEMDRLPSVP
jgi:hypothetical protein